MLHLIVSVMRGRQVPLFPPGWRRPDPDLGLTVELKSVDTPGASPASPPRPQQRRRLSVGLPTGMSFDPGLFSDGHQFLFFVLTIAANNPVRPSHPISCLALTTWTLNRRSPPPPQSATAPSGILATDVIPGHEAPASGPTNPTA